MDIIGSVIRCITKLGLIGEFCSSEGVIPTHEIFHAEN